MSIPPLSSYTVNVSYRYDANGRLERLFIPGEQVAPYPYDYNRNYDGLGRLKQIFNAADTNPHFEYWYDNASNVTRRRTHLCGSEQRFDPDEINRPRSRTLQARSFDNFPDGVHEYDFSVEAYRYDKMSRLTETSRTLRSPGGTVALTRDSFAYNGAGELTNVKYGQPSDGQGGFGTPAREVSYDLDNVGNRDGMAGVNENGSMTGYYANELNEYTTVGGASTSAQTIQYSSHHELTKYQSTNYRYLADGQLSQIFPDVDGSRAGGTYNLGYDALGRCVRRATGGQPIYYIYDGARVIAEFNPSTSVMTARNIYGNGIDEIVMRDLGTLTFPFQDRLGSTSALLETYGRVVEQYRYDAYGTPEFRTGPSDTDPNGTLRTNGTMNNNRYLFTGREWMQRYRIYEYRARAYHPGLGRFLQEDPMSFAAGDTNLFRYCGGDPVNMTDPTGLNDRPWPMNGSVVNNSFTPVRVYTDHWSAILPPLRSTPNSPWASIDVDTTKWQGNYYYVPGASTLYLYPFGIAGLILGDHVPGMFALPSPPLHTSPGNRSIPANDDRNILLVTETAQTTATTAAMSTVLIFIPTDSPLNNAASARAIGNGANPTQLVGSAVFDSHAANALLMWSQSLIDPHNYARPDEPGYLGNDPTPGGNAYWIGVAAWFAKRTPEQNRQTFWDMTHAPQFAPHK